MNPITNGFCQFDPLEEVWVGDTWPEEFYFDLKPDVRDVFSRITDITKRSLENLSDVLRSLNVTVRRPEFDSDSSYYRDHQGNLLRPPVPIRDDNITIGENQLFHLRSLYKKDPWQRAIQHYKNNGATVIESGQLDPYGYLITPSIVRLGKDILIDIDSHNHCWNLMEEKFIPMLHNQGFRVLISKTDGHVDSVFSILKPGHILTSHWKVDYSLEFPNWDIHYVPKEAITPKGVINQVSLTNCWWINDNNGTTYPAFNEYVAKNAKDWIGNPLETVYIVNCLVVNENLVITTGQPDKSTVEWFKKIGVEYIPIKFDTGQFWDSGMHCVTVDIRRKSKMHDFFPERTKKIYRLT